MQISVVILETPMKLLDHKDILQANVTIIAGLVTLWSIMFVFETHAEDGLGVLVAEFLVRFFIVMSAGLLGVSSMKIIEANTNELLGDSEMRKAAQDALRWTKWGLRILIIPALLSVLAHDMLLLDQVMPQLKYVIHQWMPWSHVLPPPGDAVWGT